MATKAELEKVIDDRDITIRELDKEVATLLNSAVVDEMVELKKTLAETESYCKDFENRIHELVGENQELKKELSTACHYRGLAESKSNQLANRLSRVEGYIVNSLIDGSLK